MASEDPTAPPKRPRARVDRAPGELALGTVVGGRYRLDTVLGRGGMAVVFSAKHLVLGHDVAIKILHPEAARSPSQAERIEREARAAVGLTSENATRVLDIGTLDSGDPYIVMERLEGSDLGRVLVERGPLPIATAVSYVVQACDAIAEAHARGIIHRDLKPSNLFLTQRRDGSPLVKLMDFGISKVISGATEESLTATHDSLGTPHYMSPEQLMTSRDVDTGTDVWALGVILYRMLTGKYPFVGETTPAVHVAVASLPTPRLRDPRPDAPPGLEHIIFACLAKSRSERAPSVLAVAQALLPYADDDTRLRYSHLGRRELPVGTASVGPIVGETAMAHDLETRSTWGASAPKAKTPRRRSGRGPVAIVASVSIVAVALAAMFFAVGRSPRAAGSASVDPTDPVAPAATPPPFVPAVPSAVEDVPRPAPSAATTSSSSSVSSSGSPTRRRAPLAPSSRPTTTPKMDPYGQRR